MHELSVTENILALALHHAAEAGARQVTDLYLVLGELASIVDDSVQFYWDFVSQDSIAAGATLHFRRIPAQICCDRCQYHYSPKEALTCPACASRQTTIIAGEEFYLEAIDVD